jgi:hypothetical protein
VAFFLISCEDALSPLDNSPSPNENPLGGESDPPLGYWRIWGIIDAPLDWTPGYPYLVEIWMFGRGGTDQLIVPMTFTLLFTGQDSRRWSFKTGGDYYYGEGQTDYYPYFIPDPTWWSFPLNVPPVYGHTDVRGYKWVQFGGSWSLVLADEDWSFNPYNPPGSSSDWKYYQTHGLEDPYWAWDTVYLDLR